MEERRGAIGRAVRETARRGREWGAALRWIGVRSKTHWNELRRWGARRRQGGERQGARAY